MIRTYGGIRPLSFNHLVGKWENQKFWPWVQAAALVEPEIRDTR